MNKFTYTAIASGILLAGAQMAMAGSPREKGEIFFYPLTQSAAVATVTGEDRESHYNEVHHP